MSGHLRQGSGAQDCLFCKIIAGQIPGSVIYQDDAVVAGRGLSWPPG